MRIVNDNMTQLALLSLLAITSLSATASSNLAIDQVIDSFHQAASDADSVRYFDLLSEDSIFLGTDGTERWTKKEFKSYVEPYFKQGKGWTYISTERHINLSSDGETAFFDELLINKNYGQCRGSGVLWKTAKGWKIAQYNLSVPLPNAIAKDIVAKINQFSVKVTKQNNE